MNETTIYSIAYEMLQSTNPYRKNIEDFVYKNEGQQVRLIDLTYSYLENSRSGYRNLSTKNYIEAYHAIANAMVRYLENFHSTYSYKQHTKSKFCKWLESIQEKYETGKIDLPLELNVEEEDFGIALVKALHLREGITKEGLQEKLDNCDLRTIQKNLRRLSPQLYEGPEAGEKYSPLRIGGQPITVKINMKKGENQKRYYNTPNTLHPIVLQENLLQVEILLRSLSLSFDKYNSTISYYIALDIWSQLSDYAKDKIKSDFEYEEDIHLNFIRYVDEDTPDNHTCLYKTQREMIEEIDPSVYDILRDVEKVPNRRCAIRYKNEIGNCFYLEDVKIKRLNQFEYAAIDKNGDKHIFQEDWVGSITIL